MRSCAAERAWFQGAGDGLELLGSFRSLLSAARVDSDVARFVALRHSRRRGWLAKLRDGALREAMRMPSPPEMEALSNLRWRPPPDPPDKVRGGRIPAIGPLGRVVPNE